MILSRRSIKINLDATQQQMPEHLPLTPTPPAALVTRLQFA